MSHCRSNTRFISKLKINLKFHNSFMTSGSAIIMFMFTITFSVKLIHSSCVANHKYHIPPNKILNVTSQIWNFNTQFKIYKQTNNSQTIWRWFSIYFLHHMSHSTKLTHVINWRILKFNFFDFSNRWWSLRISTFEHCNLNILNLNF